MIKNFTIYFIQLLSNLVSTSCSKMCLLLGNEIEKTLNLKQGTNIYTIISSTILAAIGKFVFIFLPYTSIIPLLFIFQGICLLGCVTKYFIIFRTLQGFFSGWLLSITFGLMGYISDTSRSFEIFTTTATLLSTLVPILNIFLGIKMLFYILSIINFISAIILFFAPIKAQCTIKKTTVQYFDFNIICN